MKIAQVTDLHIDDFLAEYYDVDTRANLLAVLDDVVRRGISDVVLTGDLGVPESHPWLIQTIESYGLNAMAILGNHDKIEDCRKLPFVAQYFKDDGLYYAAALGSLTCLFLDSSSGTIRESQMEWFKTQLQGRDGHTAVFVHHPIYDCGLTTMDRLFPLQNRQTLQQILNQTTAEVTVFCGHYHTEHVQRRGNVSQYVTPSTLLQFKRYSEQVELESRSIGYRIIESTDEVVRSDVVSI